MKMFYGDLTTNNTQSPSQNREGRDTPNHRIDTYV